jgi:hypothetical protein
LLRLPYIETTQWKYIATPISNTNIKLEKMKDDTVYNVKQAMSS